MKKSDASVNETALVFEWRVRLRDLEAKAQFSWRARLDARVLQFLLARYGPPVSAQNLPQNPLAAPERALLWPQVCPTPRPFLSLERRVAALGRIARTRRETERELNAIEPAWWQGLFAD